MKPELAKKAKEGELCILQIHFMKLMPGDILLCLEQGADNAYMIWSIFLSRVGIVRLWNSEVTVLR